MIKRVAIVASLLICGCKPEANNSDIHYFQDKRTDICFAYADWGTNYQTFTTVDCAKVEKYLEDLR